MRPKQVAGSVAWALIYAAITAWAMLWIDSGRNLLGGLAFAINRIPRQILLSVGGADPAQTPALNASIAGAFVFVVAFLFLTASNAVADRNSADRRALPLAAILVGLIILCEILALVFGRMPRYVFGERSLSLFLFWHLAAFALTVFYVVWSRRTEFPGWARRSYWLTIFVMTLCVLFPMTDAL